MVFTAEFYFLQPAELSISLDVVHIALNIWMPYVRCCTNFLRNVAKLLTIC